MSLAHTLERSRATASTTTRTGQYRTTSPRPVTARVARTDHTTLRAEYGRRLPTALLTLTQRTGHRPWVMPLLALGFGILAASVQRSAMWLPLLVIAAGFALCVAVVAIAWLVRRRVFSGAALRPQEAVIDTDQAIPSAALAPVALMVGWVVGTLLL